MMDDDGRRTQGNRNKERKQYKTRTQLTDTKFII